MAASQASTNRQAGQRFSQPFTVIPTQGEKTKHKQNSRTGEAAYLTLPGLFTARSDRTPRRVVGTIGHTHFHRRGSEET